MPGGYVFSYYIVDNIYMILRGEKMNILDKLDKLAKDHVIISSIIISLFVIAMFAFVGFLALSS